MAEIGIRLESAGVERLMERLSAALEGREHLVDAFLQSIDGDPEFFRVDLERLSATGAIQLRAVFEPTDLLRELFRAVGAGDIDRLIVENSGHGDLHAK